MFNVFQKKKLEALAGKMEVNTQTGEVKLYQVGWNARKGPYSSDVYRTAKSFVTKNDAIAFKNSWSMLQKF